MTSNVYFEAYSMVVHDNDYFISWKFHYDYGYQLGSGADCYGIGRCMWRQALSQMTYFYIHSCLLKNESAFTDQFFYGV